MRLLMIAAGLAASVGTAHADEAEANRLLVEAIGLAAEAADLPPAEALPLYAQAVANLDAIVAGHPETNVAVMLATHQPIGTFRSWEVRHEYARLNAGPAEPACAAPCVWEHQYGDGSGNPLRGGSTWLMTDVLPRPDGTIVVVGNYWHGPEKDVWLVALGPDGVRLWERTYTGVACDAALIDDGIVVLADDVIRGEEAGVLMVLSDGLAPTGFPVTFEPHAIAADGSGGFLVMGGGDAPVIARHDASGEQLWSWSEPGSLVPGARTGAVTAATVMPGGDIRVLGFWEGIHAEGGERVIWSGVLGSDGTMRDLREIDRVTPETFGVGCDPVVRPWQIAALGEDVIVRYSTRSATTANRSTIVARLDATGAEQWRRVEPVDPSTQPDPAAWREAGLDEVLALSVSRDGDVLVAGYRHRPEGRGAGYVSRWDGAGETVWTTELRRPAANDRVDDAWFSAIAEAPDGGVLAVMTDGLAQLRLRGFIFRLGPDGEAP